MLWDVEYIICYNNGEWGTAVATVLDDDLDHCESIEQSFVEHFDLESFSAVDDIVYIGVIYYSEHTENNDDA